MIPARPRNACPKPAPLEVWVHREVLYTDAQGRNAEMFTACLFDPATQQVVGSYVTPAYVLRTDAIARVLQQKDYMRGGVSRRRYVLRGAL